MNIVNHLKQIASISTIILCISAGAFNQATAAERYIVSGVKSWDTLNIRSQPSARSTIIGEIPATGSNVNSSGEESVNGRTTWTKINWNGVTGWVSKRYLATDYSFTPPTAPAPVAPASTYNPRPAQVTTSVARTGNIYGSSTSASTVSRSSHSSVYVGPDSGLPTVTTKRLESTSSIQGSTTPPRRANSVSHTHPANSCTRSSTHSHPGGENTAHQHRYSCQGKASNQQTRTPGGAAHTHPRNQFSNAVTHTHASGSANHNHSQRTTTHTQYSQPQRRVATTGTAHTHPRNQFSNAVTHTHASNNPQHSHNYSGQRTRVTTTGGAQVTHIHPETQYNQRTRHTHSNGAGVHLHDFLLPQSGQVQQSQTVSNDANLHRHQANQFTRSTAHSHPNGRATHNHNYSGQR